MQSKEREAAVYTAVLFLDAFSCVFFLYSVHNKGKANQSTRWRAIFENYTWSARKLQRKFIRPVCLLNVLSVARHVIKFTRPYANSCWSPLSTPSGHILALSPSVYSPRYSNGHGPQFAQKRRDTHTHTLCVSVVVVAMFCGCCVAWDYLEF